MMAECGDCGEFGEGEGVRAKLKAIVKRTLRQYGYPPDMQLLATETVLKQAEMIANELAEGAGAR